MEFSSKSFSQIGPKKIIRKKGQVQIYKYFIINYASHFSIIHQINQKYIFIFLSFKSAANSKIKLINTLKRNFLKNFICHKEKVYEKVWKSMKKYIRKHTKKYEKAWISMNKYEKVWKSMKKLKKAWLSVEKYEKVWKKYKKKHDKA